MITRQPFQTELASSVAAVSSLAAATDSFGRSLPRSSIVTARAGLRFLRISDFSEDSDLLRVQQPLLSEVAGD